jgi:hypothetical protein
MALPVLRIDLKILTLFPDSKVQLPVLALCQPNSTPVVLRVVLVVPVFYQLSTVPLLLLATLVVLARYQANMVPLEHLVVSVLPALFQASTMLPVVLVLLILCGLNTALLAPQIEIHVPLPCRPDMVPIEFPADLVALAPYHLNMVPLVHQTGLKV